MNDQTAQLLQQLASKMGTTTEYLWSVLLKQAPISAAMDLLITLATAVGGYLLFKLNSKFSKKNPDDKYGESYYSNNEGYIIIMGVGFISWVIMAIACVLNLELVVAGFFNPEYWALQKILSAAKS